MMNQRSVEEVHRVVSEILAGDAIPFVMGGTHIQMYGIGTALAQKYGPESFAVLHVDAHYDTYLYGFGRFVHNGSFLTLAIEKGILKGSDLIQVGLRGPAPDAKSFAWMRDNKLRFHFQAEINRDGWDKVLGRIAVTSQGTPCTATVTDAGLTEQDGLLLTGFRMSRPLTLDSRHTSKDLQTIRRPSERQLLPKTRISTGQTTPKCRISASLGCPCRIPGPAC